MGAINDNVKGLRKKDGTRVKSHQRPPSNVKAHTRCDTDVRSNVRCTDPNMKVFQFGFEATPKPMKSAEMKSAKKKKPKSIEIEIEITKRWIVRM